ncbi:MAG TPA: transcriptional regulator [Burkholderiaceae bacterium]|jgi:HTH-type transcriptional regulator/antitoxin HipB
MSAPLPPQSLVSGEQLSQLLRSTRKRLKLNQSTVGARLNLSQNRVSYLELHPDELSFKQLLTWCSALGLELKLGARGADAAELAKSEW